MLEGYFGGPQQRAFIALERLLARHTDVLVAVSPEVRDELVDLGVGKPAQYRVIPLGLDLAPFLAVGSSGGAKDQQVRGKLRASLGLGPDVPLAGIVGRLVPVKDHATLFAALATVPDVHLAVLGDGELRQALGGQGPISWALADVPISPVGGRTCPKPLPTWTSWCWPAATRGRPWP